MLDTPQTLPANDPELIELSMRVREAAEWKTEQEGKELGTLLFGRPVLQGVDGPIHPATNALEPVFLSSGNIWLKERQFSLNVRHKESPFLPGPGSNG